MVNFAALRERIGYKVFDASEDQVIHGKDIKVNFPGDENRQLFRDTCASIPAVMLDEKFNQMLSNLGEDLQHNAADTTLTLLIDNRGGMRGYPGIENAAALNWMSEALEKAGISHEILGFTTVDWKAEGQFRALRLRREETGQHDSTPGRIGSLMHVVWKSAEETAAEFSEICEVYALGQINKDNVDGEALEWAYGRISERSESHKGLIALKVGHLAPISDPSYRANKAGPLFLWKHTEEVAAAISEEGRVALSAVVTDPVELKEIVLPYIAAKDHPNIGGAYGNVIKVEKNDREVENLCLGLIDAVEATLRKIHEPKNTAPAP